MSEERELARKTLNAGLLAEEGEPLPEAPPKYTVERLLGRGGCGSVYLARDDSLHRPVALKFLQNARPVDVERFLREARFAARLQSPAIVQVYETGTVGNVPFIAMQYVDGGNLANVELRIPEALDAVRQVAAALVHAHRIGIVHRDIKPENILLDWDRKAYVTDFGIARDLRGELGATISVDGQIMGTPALMPPEQAQGKIDAIDGRSDVYSLGATLYFKLTGKWPFEADSLVELLHSVIHDEPVLPRAHNAGIPAAVEALIVRCMRKRRQDRYASMQEVVEALDNAGQGVALAPGNSPWFASHIRSRMDVPPAPAPEPEPEIETDFRAAMEMAREIAAWDMHLYRVRSNLPRTFPQLERVVDQMNTVLTDRPAAGWARFYRGLARFRLGEWTEALEDMERTIDRVRDLSGAYFELGRVYLALYLDEHQRAQAHFSRAGVEHDLAEARSRVEQAAVAFEQARELNHAMPRWQTRYVDAVRKLAEEDYEGCEAACGEIVNEEPDLEGVWKLRGDALRRLGRDPLACYERAVEIRRSYVEAYLAAAEVLTEAARLEEAQRSLDAALEVHPQHVRARALRARLHLRAARAADASAEESNREIEAGVDQVQQARELDPRNYEAAVTFAELRLAQGDPDAGLAILDEAGGLPGCQNRVQYLSLVCRLERARQTRKRGGDPRPDLERILARRHHESVRMPDNEPWLKLLAEAEAELNQL